MNTNWESDELAKDRDRGTITDNYWDNFNKPLPQQEPSKNSYFCAEWVIKQIKEMPPPEKDFFCLSDFIEHLPSLEKVRDIIDAVEIQLGIIIEVEKISTDNSDKLNLLISWC